MSQGFRGFRVLLTFGFRAAPWQIVLLFCLGLLSVVASLGTAWGLKLLAEGVIGQQLDMVILAALAVAGLQAIGALGGQHRINLGQMVTEKTSAFIDRQLMRLSAGISTLAHHELPDYLREMDLLREDRSRFGEMANTSLYAVQEVLHLAGTAALLATLDPRLLLLPLFAVGSILADRRAWQRYLAALNASAELRRRKMHFFGLATSPEAGKELRVFDLGREMVARHGADGAEQLRIQTRPLWNGLILQALAAALLAVGYGGAIALVLARALQGQVTPGDVLLAITLAAQMQDLVGELVSSGNSWLRVVREASRYLWLVDYAKQVDRGPATRMPVPSTLSHGVEFQNVSFRYPGTDAAVLQNISLHLEAGRVVALVGENGAGKTTLAKLLARFYEPTAGRITVDGVEVKQFEVEAWRSRLSAGFQDYSRFEFLVRETVGVGDVARIENTQAVHEALAKADAQDIPHALPRGLETQLGRVWKEGVELSGGQWQKLALGRAFMRTQPLLVILDEPTAALDAQTEHGVFERIAAASRRGQLTGTVTLLISHRFSTVRMADHIIVLHQGRIVEQGSHDDLMQEHGLYAELYELQARHYQ